MNTQGKNMEEYGTMIHFTSFAGCLVFVTVSFRGDVVSDTAAINACGRATEWPRAVQLSEKQMDVDVPRLRALGDGPRLGGPEVDWEARRCPEDLVRRPVPPCHPSAFRQFVMWI